MSRTLVPVVVALAACSDPPPEASFTEDRRIDAADPGNDPDSIGTRMCTTDDGHVYVAWLDDRARDDGGVDLWMNRSADLGASWLPAPVQVNHGDGSVWNPALHCDDDGVYVVWEDDRDGELQMHQVYYNQSTDGGETFLPDDRRLDDDPDGGSMSIGPQITGDGRALFVVWSDGANGAYDVMLTRGSPDGDWTEPVRMDSDPRGSAHSGQARVAVGGGGVWVVWEDTRNGASDIFVATSTDGGATFEQDLQLDPGPDSDAFAPVLCTDGASDSVYAVWYDDRNGDGNDIYASWSRDGGLGWSGAVRLEVDAPGFGDSVSPACVADGDTAHVVWRDQAAPGEGTDIWYRAVVAGIPGGDPVRVDTGRPAGHSNSIAPTVVRDADKLLIGWLDDRGSVEQGIEGYDDLYYNWSEAGRPFGATDARIDSMPDGASYKDDLQLGLIGNRWYAAWTDGREGTKDIWFQSFALGEQGEARPDEPPPGR